MPNDAEKPVSVRQLHQFALARFEALDVEGDDSSPARALRSALERTIMVGISTAKGKPALTRLVSDLNALGHRLKPKKSDPGWHSYFQATNEGTRHFHIHVHFGEPLTVMVLYGETLDATVARRRSGMSKSERARAHEEDHFIDRGLKLNTGRKPYASLGPADRLIACLHELEGGVSNGGFRTYLSNTGGVRIRDAHRYLEQIGARRTATIVGKVRALFPRGFGAAFRRDAEPMLEKHRVALDKLADEFYRSRDNIPLLAHRYAESRRTRSRLSSVARKRR